MYSEWTNVCGVLVNKPCKPIIFTNVNNNTSNIRYPPGIKKISKEHEQKKMEEEVNRLRGKEEP